MSGGGDGSLRIQCSWRKLCDGRDDAVCCAHDDDDPTPGFIIHRNHLNTVADPTPRGPAYCRMDVPGFARNRVFDGRDDGPSAPDGVLASALCARERGRENNTH